MLRSAFSSLLLVTVLSAPAAFAQQNSKKSAKPAAKTPPAPMEASAPAAPAPANDGFGAPAAVGRVADAPAQQSEGFSIAPGFTAAPSRRVNTDYRGRALTPYVRRNVREAAPVAAPMPMPTPEPVAVAPEPAPEPVTASASATKKSSGAAAAKKTTTTKKAAPAKKSGGDGWGSGGSGW